MKSSQQRKESEVIGDMDVVNFLIRVFPTYYVVACPNPIRDAVNSISQISTDVFLGWINHYRESELDILKNPSSQASSFGIFSQSSIHLLLYSLLKDGCASLHDTDNEDFVQKYAEIKNAIFNDLMTYLRNLSIDEER